MTKNRPNLNILYFFRKKFLNVNLFPNPNQSLTDNCTKRSNVKDDISEYVLPPFDLTPYMIKDPHSIDDNNRLKFILVTIEKIYGEERVSEI